MGFGRIGRAFRRVGRVFRGVKDIAGKAFSAVSKPLSAITKPFQQLANKVLDKLPFGRFLKPFVNTFLSNPLSFIAGGPLGMFGNLAARSMGPGGFGLGNLLGTVSGGVGGFANLTPQGLNNVAQITAFTQAQGLLRRF